MSDVMMQLLRLSSNLSDKRRGCKWLFLRTELRPIHLSGETASKPVPGEETKAEAYVNPLAVPTMRAAAKKPPIMCT